MRSMEQLTLQWRGPYHLTQTTPEEIRGQKELFLLVNDSKRVFIGKARYGKGVFREVDEDTRVTY